MAKRKLYGAAKAAHERRIGRKRSTALVRRSSSALAPRRRRSYALAPRRRRRRGGGGILGGGGGGGGGFMASLKAQLPQLLGATAYGWMTGADSVKAAEFRRDWLDKLPTSSKIGKPASHGLLLQFVATQISGTPRRVAGLLAHAALMRAGHNFGAAGGNTDKFSAMSGDDDGDDEFSGAMDADYDMDGSDPSGADDDAGDEEDEGGEG